MSSQSDGRTTAAEAQRIGDVSLPRTRGDTLNLGCGRKPLANAVNVDSRVAVGPDLVHDLNRIPWPFPDDRFLEVTAYDVIEHLEDVIRTLEEIHRVCRDGALVKITVPHFSSPNAYTDVTHRHLFGWGSFDYLLEAHELSFYSRARFERRVTRLIFHPTLVNKVAWRLSNRFPREYERRWAWLFPAWFLYVELQVVKPPTSAAGR